MTISGLGRRWLDRMESHLGRRTLRRGADHVGVDLTLDLAISPGRASTPASSGGRLEYRTDLTVPLLDDDRRRVLIETIAADNRLVAALLDGDLPADVVAPLLPEARSIDYRCTCPLEAPCKHVGAITHLVADAVDEDVLDLVTLRGLPPDELRASVLDHRRHDRGDDGDAAPTGAGRAMADPGDTAGGDRPQAPPDDAPAFRWSDGDGRPPATRAVPAAAGRLAPFPSAPPETAPFTEHGLRHLVADAADRALLALSGDDVPGWDLDVDADIARRAAEIERLDDPDRWRDLVARVGVSHAELRGRVAAWEAAGAEGVAAHIAPAVTELDDDGVQWRRTVSGHWIPFVKQKGRWTAAGPGRSDQPPR